MPNVSDNCPTTPNPNQANRDGDSTGDACDPDIDGDGIANGSDPEADGDGVMNVDEASCGGNSLNSLIRPERLDGLFDNVSDDGDAPVDEALPPGSAGFDCDGDGWKGSEENLIFGGAPSTARDQDPCGNGGWPADLVADNTLTIGDINSFLFPQRANGSFSKIDHPVPDPQDANIARWNLLPDATINIGDLNALNPAVIAPTSRPPMFHGQPAFFTDAGNGLGGCPFPP